MNDKPLGISGRIAKAFLSSEITPLLAITGLLLGLFAVLITPREEEPQINVTFANVFIPFPGASAKEVESLVTTPAEQIISEISGVENIYSASSPGMAILTVRFTVGEPRTEAIVRLYNAFYSNQDALSPNIGVGQPLIKPKGIDDVPIVAGTLWSKNPEVTSEDLLRIAHSIETELQRVKGTRDIEIIGGPDRVIRIQFDPIKMSGLGITLSDIQNMLSGINASAHAGSILSDNQEVLVKAGIYLSSPEELGAVIVGLSPTPDGQSAAIFLRDVATVSSMAEQAERYVSFATKEGRYPAVTLSVSKKPGENAVEVANAVIERFEQMRGIIFPDDIQASITRNYGATAQDKAQTLIKKLLFATLSVVALVFISIGKREAFVVGSAVIVTLAITLFSSWAWGFTLNRVSLFALIFSIGILVDDAIVVVENIHRHMQLGAKNLKDAIPLAVDEVGGPTILATFTVIAALLPMAFVTGLMGPYMRPIPINASTGMLISLVVAFMFTPWLYFKLFVKSTLPHSAEEHNESHPKSRLNSMFTLLMMPFLNTTSGKRNRWFLLFALIGLISLSVTLVVSGSVVLKMLPFDNKSEFQVLVDMPEGTPLEETYKVLQALADHIDTVPEVTHYQLYAGTSAPINFNGLVRQYYLREQPYQGDIQVNLLDKHDRSRKSHDIATSVHKKLTEIGKVYGANVKMVEVPPGPPVLAPLVAEIYGLDYQKQQAVAKKVRAVFEASDNIIDVDDTGEAQQKRLIISIDQSRSAQLGLSQADIVQTIRSALSGSDISYLHDQQAKTPIAIRVQLPATQSSDLELIQSIQIRSQHGVLVALSEVTDITESTREQTIYHKDLLPVVYVTGDVSGGTDSPLYGLANISSTLEETDIDGAPIKQFFTHTPDNPYQWSLKWDGEWDVTFKTFRDMGAAYAVGLILIYLLVVAQFGSYGVPLIIMAPIPLTMIGILPGHAILGQQFTAPSMIGMIALAGIIVRNSILLVDFIQLEVATGKQLRQATIDAAVVRAKPIALTALAAMMGGFFIIDDPIFGGLAVSLIFGLLVSTVLTLLVIPVVYYHFAVKTKAVN